MPIRALPPGGRTLAAFTPGLLALLVLIAAFSPALARAAVTGRDALPAALTHQLQPLAGVPRFEAQALDPAALAVEDAQRERDGLAPRYAIPQPVALSPANAGAWETLDGGLSVWRLRVSSPGALSLNLGFTQFRLPKAGRLCVYPLNDPAGGAAWTETDNADHGQLWTQVLPGDALVIELTVPTEFRPETRLELGSVNVGYRDFGRLALAEKAGTCNIDVVCPQGDPWRDEIQAVAVISTGGSTFCTGFMVNNTAQDGKPYFQTANHCGITAGNAASLVCYWNFESPTCGAQSGGSLSQFQSGSTFRATYATSDFTLVELSASPNPAWNVTFAGWDRSSADPSSAVSIHHPNTDEKSISFTTTPLQTATYLGTTTPGDGTHLRVVQWTAGTTEPGSSGSPLFDQNHHIVGQLHGGYASCTSLTSDYYGRFSVSWTGGGTSATRLSNWLDPLNTGATTLALFAPNAQSLAVAPGSGLAASGPVGGPFSPDTITYTLTNRTTASLAWHVSNPAFWLDVSPASGSIAVAGTATVTVSLNMFANTLTANLWSATLGFVNDTDHSGDTTRGVTTQVGSPTLAYGWNLDVNPGWTMQGSWQYGMPTGVAGDHGTGDPISGHTGANVLGYNLTGGYTNNMVETSLTTTALDCSNMSSVTLRFWRWLGVEQSTYDHAYLRVSTDNVNWMTVWQNDSSTLMETAWSRQEYDLTAIAAGRPRVYIRWVMGITDSSWTYCGWNIDDIELWGYQQQPVATEMSLFKVDNTASGVRVRWMFVDPSRYTSSWIERATDGRWVRIDAPVVSSPDGLAVVDATAQAGMAYSYRVAAATTAGAMVTFEPVTITAANTITEFALDRVWPNPTKSGLTVSFSVPRAAYIGVKVFDIRGRLVTTLVNANCAPGHHTVPWNGRTRGGERVPNGVYFVHLDSPAKGLVQRVTVVR